MRFLQLFSGNAAKSTASMVEECLERVVRPLNQAAEACGDRFAARLNSNNRAGAEVAEILSIDDIFAFEWEFIMDGETIGILQYRPATRTKSLLGSVVYLSMEKLELYPAHDGRNGLAIWQIRNYLRIVRGTYPYEACAEELAQGLALDSQETKRIAELTGRTGNRTFDRNHISPAVLQAAYLMERAELVAAKVFQQDIRPLTEQGPRWAVAYAAKVARQIGIRKEEQP